MPERGLRRLTAVEVGKVRAPEGCLCEFILQHEAERCTVSTSQLLLASLLRVPQAVVPITVWRCALLWAWVHVCPARSRGGQRTNLDVAFQGTFQLLRQGLSMARNFATWARLDKEPGFSVELRDPDSGLQAPEVEHFTD